jgi:hypothetical protein
LLTVFLNVSILLTWAWDVLLSLTLFILKFPGINQCRSISALVWPWSFLKLSVTGTLNDQNVCQRPKNESNFCSL